jgi:hypothetical protein
MTISRPSINNRSVQGARGHGHVFFCIMVITGKELRNVREQKRLSYIDMSLSTDDLSIKGRYL